MYNFNIGSLRDWTPIAPGEVFRFEIPQDGSRRVDFDLLTDAAVSVVVETCRMDVLTETMLDSQESWLVAYGSGMMNVRFAMNEPLTLTVVGPEDCVIMMRTKLLTQVLSDSGEPSWTNIEPRMMSQSERVTAIQSAMLRNQERRVAALLADLESRSVELIERAAPAPAPAVAPAPAPASEKVNE